jgi:putative DNA primase/helicase
MSTGEFFRGTERGAAWLDERINARTPGSAATPTDKPPDGNPRPGGPAGDSGGWPEPQPLTTRIDPELYPLDALPDTLRAAVEEVQGFVQAPVPLVASSALGALSLACQAYADVQRAEKLQGPAGLFLLTIADSGERKTTCDGFFTSTIRQYQEEQAELLKPVVKEYRAALAAWEAKRDGILSAIKDAAKRGKDTEVLRAELALHQTVEPEAPRAPRLLLGDETPESLAWTLAHHWPSAGVVASEAATVLGSHGMGKDSVMRNLGLLNTLWDGGSLSIGRRTSECFTVRGARLTMALQVQEATLREFLEKSGALARGSGFLARFLIAWPESTQGQRSFIEAPANWPHLAAFHRRIAAILNQSVPVNGEGALTPVMLTFAPEAKAAWIAFHDAIESELTDGGELHDVRDVASKAADNAARLAALFHVFEGMGGDIGLNAFEGASRIAAWHLSESRRFFGELALPAELADAVRLDDWLIEYGRRERTGFIGKNHVRQHGPLRDKERLDAAIRELSELGRVRLEKEGKRLTIHLNPLLRGVPHESY